MNQCDIAQKKQTIRNTIWEKLGYAPNDPQFIPVIPDFVGSGIATEKIRTLESYRTARIIFSTPDRVLQQFRLNALMDQKVILVATPALRKGFCLLNPRKLAFNKRQKAVQSQLLCEYGTPVSVQELRGLAVDLLLTGSVAVDKTGRRLGKGKGFFDLEYAILSLLEVITKETPTVTIIGTEQVVEEIPVTASDVGMNSIITPADVYSIESPYRPTHGLDWNSRILHHVDRRFFYDLHQQQEPVRSGN